MHLGTFLALVLSQVNQVRAFLLTGRNQDSRSFQRGWRRGVALDSSSASNGLYRPVAEMVWETIGESFPNLHSFEFDPTLAENQAKNVHIETRALTGAPTNATNEASSPVRYARMALLEAPEVPQVLNLVIFPHSRSSWPVWSCDFVSLPGGRHLLLLDAQPMSGRDEYSHLWEEWYDTHKVATLFPWGGDMPEAVQQFVSKKALWTRFAEENETETPIERIRGPLMSAVEEHLSIYIDLLTKPMTESANQQSQYIEYRLANDPARPMLKSLYGEEWTERTLTEVLFPR